MAKARSPITDDDDVNLDDLDAEPAANANGSDDDDDEGDDSDPDDDADDDSGDELPDDQGDDEPLAADNAGDDGDEPHVRRPRENSRVRDLSDRLRRSEEDRKALERRFDDFVGRRTGNQDPPGESAEQRNARRALMTVEERQQEDIQELRRDTTNAVNRIGFQTAESADKSIFQARCTSDPLYQKWSARVEDERQKSIARGAPVDRQLIFEVLVGRAMLEARGSKKVQSQKARGQRRVQRQTVNAGSSRSDEGSSRRGGKTLEDRLSNVRL